MLTGVKLEVEEMALTAPSQRRKLEVVLEAITRSLQAEERQLKWSVESKWGLGWGGGARVPLHQWPLLPQHVCTPASGMGTPRGLGRSRSMASWAQLCSCWEPTALCTPEHGGVAATEHTVEP